MRAIAIALSALCLAIPGAGVADVSAQRKEKPAIVPLRERVTLLERRVKALERQTATLRVLVCLQLPTC